jgi:hypothetical protein
MAAIMGMAVMDMEAMDMRAPGMNTTGTAITSGIPTVRGWPSMACCS